MSALGRRRPDLARRHVQREAHVPQRLVQNHPRIAFFVVDRTTSKGYGSLDEGLKDFGAKTAQKPK